MLEEFFAVRSTRGGKYCSYNYRIISVWDKKICYLEKKNKGIYIVHTYFWQNHYIYMHKSYSSFVCY